MGFPSEPEGIPKDGLGLGLGSGKYPSEPPKEPHGSETTAPSEKSTQKKAIGRVWKYYLRKTGKNPKVMSLTKSREQKGLSRLNECLKKTGGDLERAATLLEGCVDVLGL